MVIAKFILCLGTFKLFAIGRECTHRYIVVLDSDTHTIAGGRVYPVFLTSRVVDFHSTRC